MINTANAKGILFSTAMVKAIQEERKTQTRRVVKPQGIRCYKGVYSRPCTERYVLDDASNNLYCADCGNIIEYSPEGKDYCRTISAPYQPGTILYVKETFQKLDSSVALDLEHGEYCYVYKATENGEAWASEMEDWKWRSPLYMPKEAARIWLEVTGVKVERVQDITEEDCIAEGMSEIAKMLTEGGAMAFRDEFAWTWDDINAKPKPVYRTINGRKHIAHYESYPWKEGREILEYRGKEWRVHGNPWVRAYIFRDVSGEVEKDA